MHDPWRPQHRLEPQDGVYRAVDDAIRKAEHQERLDVACVPLFALGLFAREISPRAGRWLAMQAVGTPASFDLIALRDRWRRGSGLHERAAMSPVNIKRALDALLLAPAIEVPEIDVRSTSSIQAFAAAAKLDDVLALPARDLSSFVFRPPDVPEGNATLRDVGGHSGDLRVAVGKALLAAWWNRHASRRASERVDVDITGDFADERQNARDKLLDAADAIAKFRVERWLPSGPSSIDLSERGLVVVEHRNGGHVRAAALLSMKGVEVHGDDEAANERALRLLADIVAEPEGKRETEIVHAMLTPRHRVLLDALAALARNEKDSAREERVCWVIERHRWSETVAVEPVVQRALKRGVGFTKGARVSAREIVDARHATEQDRAIASVVLQRHGALDADSLRSLRGHGLVFVDGDREQAWTIEEHPVRVAFHDVDEGYEVSLEAGGMTVETRSLPRGANVRSVAVFDDDAHRIVIASVAPALRDIGDVLDKSGGFIPLDAKESLVDVVHRVASAAPLSLPPSLEGERRPADDRIHARLVVDDNAPLTVRIGVRPAPHGALLVPGTGDAAFAGILEQKRTIFDRDLERERERAASVRDSLLGGGGAPASASANASVNGAHSDAIEVVDDFTLRANSDEAALAMLVSLQRERSDVVVEWKDPKRAMRVAGEGDASRLRVNVVRGVEGWLGVEGAIDVDGHLVSLGALLEQVRLGRKFVKVGDGAFIALAESLRARLQPLAAFANDVDVNAALVGASSAGGPVQIAPSAALALDDLAEAGAKFDETKLWLELRARADRARAVDDAPPIALNAQLRPYQRQGLLFLRRLAAWGTGGVLADDMGLGKTLQTIAVLIDRASLGPQLVVAPTSVCFNWERELAKFAPSLRARIVSSAADAELACDGAKAGDVVIISYGVAVLAEPNVCATKFASAVFDEAQAAKNPDTQRAKLARNVDADWKLALSGTPLENRLSELWSLFRVTSPGLLGGAEQFKKRFVIPIERDRSAKKRAELAQTLRPFLLRRTRSEVVPELPTLSEVVVPVELDATERALYDAARAAVLLDVAAEIEGASADRRFRVLAGLTRLRLLCCHRSFASSEMAVNDVEPSSKHNAMLHALAHVKENGHRALVFSQFTKHLDIVEALCADRGFRTLRLDGTTPAVERAKRVDAFQSGAADAFLISLKAGGAGLNLTAADYVFHLDPWWNPAVEDQATARAHRIGQEKPVTVYRFVARGTIEEQMLALHVEKRDLVDGILAGADAAAKLSLDELVSMLRS